MAARLRSIMRRLPAGWWSGLAVGLIVGVLAAGWPLAQAETAGKSDRSDRADRADLQAIQKTVKEILDGQQVIVQRLDTAIEELRVVKVRCTR